MIVHYAQASSRGLTFEQTTSTNLRNLRRDSVTKLGKLSDLPQERNQALGVVHHENPLLVDVHQLPTDVRYITEAQKR